MILKGPSQAQEQQKQSECIKNAHYPMVVVVVVVAFVISGGGPHEGWTRRRIPATSNLSP